MTTSGYEDIDTMRRVVGLVLMSYDDADLTDAEWAAMFDDLDRDGLIDLIVGLAGAAAGLAPDFRDRWANLAAVLLAIQTKQA